METSVALSSLLLFDFVTDVFCSEACVAAKSLKQNNLKCPGSVVYSSPHAHTGCIIASGCLRLEEFLLLGLKSANNSNGNDSLPLDFILLGISTEAA